MNIEESHQRVNEIYSNNFELISIRRLTKTVILK
jgi:hypothetical protein